MSTIPHPAVPALLTLRGLLHLLVCPICGAVTTVRSARHHERWHLSQGRNAEKLPPEDN